MFWLDINAKDKKNYINHCCLVGKFVCQRDSQECRKAILKLIYMYIGLNIQLNKLYIVGLSSSLPEKKVTNNQGRKATVNFMVLS